MTKTIKKTCSLLIALAMLFSLSVIGFAADDSFNLVSADVVAYSGDFKEQRVDSITLTVKTESAVEMADGFTLTVTGLDGTHKCLNKSDVVMEIYTEDSAEIVLNYNGEMSHEIDYSFSISEGSFVCGDAVSEQYDVEISGNLVLEALNVDRPSTTMQRLIHWLESWKYAKYIQFIIDLLKWFDTL